MCSNSYTKVDNAILDDDKLPRSCKAVFVVLCRHANNSDRSCWLLVSTIVKESKYAERTVRGAIRKLVEAGLITRQDRYSEDGGQISSLFTIIGADAARYHEDQTPPLQSLHTPPAIVAPITKTPGNYKDSLTREEAPDEQNQPASLSEVP
ncbi:MAG: helix-turn-helix domain-containing protein, partial [Synergistaceae bacterium]|nr:helix-turn-helix domain-containing protein [Synergistaceae bacterium]